MLRSVASSPPGRQRDSENRSTLASNVNSMYSRKTTIGIVFRVVGVAFLVLLVFDAFTTSLDYRLQRMERDAEQPQVVCKYPPPGSQNDSQSDLAPKVATRRPAPVVAYPEPEIPQQQRVVLFTYGRTGSTFTSALVNRHNDVFFIFEPLCLLTRRPVKPKRRELKAMMEAMLKCNFTAEYLNMLKFYSQDSTNNFMQCIVAPGNGIDHVQCYNKMMETCQKAKIVFVKTIRLAIVTADWFFQRNPTFKMLYLIRDPRAVLNSQARVFLNFNWTDIKNASERLCQQMTTDITEIRRINKLYPGRIKGLRYEHGAMEPFDFTRIIYEFLDLEFSEEIQKFSLNITGKIGHSVTLKNNTLDPATEFTFFRENSEAAMNKWRKSVDFKSVKIIDENCEHLYSMLGYRKVTSEKHLLSKKSLVAQPGATDLFDKLLT